MTVNFREFRAQDRNELTTVQPPKEWPASVTFSEQSTGPLLEGLDDDQLSLSIIELSMVSNSRDESFSIKRENAWYAMYISWFRNSSCSVRSAKAGGISGWAVSSKL